MNHLTKLRFSTCYSIREILLDHKNELKSILEQKLGFCLSSKETLEKLLCGILSLEETLEQLLQTLYVEPTEISFQIKKLEVLVANYQRISKKNSCNSQELNDINRQIFWILGFKRVVVKIEDMVLALMQINEYSINYIGCKITTNIWKTSRPDFEWLETFQFDRFGNITFSGISTDTADAEQLNWMHKWVIGFVCQVAHFIRDFPATIEYKRIGELPGGVLLTQMNSYSHWTSEKN